MPRDENTEQLVERLIEGGVPPRFRRARFENYIPNSAFPSQATARDRLERFVAELGRANRRGLFARLRPESVPSLYLDGGFGVGKTHLLAATWQASNVRKAYLSFQELVFAVGALGMERAVKVFSPCRLIAIDEFELDDPGNTLIVATLLAKLIPGDTRIVATSNTLPHQLGEGRFNACDFQREIHGIAAHFQTIRVDGPDYRAREHEQMSVEPLLEAGTPEMNMLETAFTQLHPRANIMEFDALCAHLASLHPIHFPSLFEQTDAFFLRHAQTICSQDVALRFVHFIDKLYENELELALSGCPLEMIFANEYRFGSYAKKYARCLSRLGELMSATNKALIRNEHFTRDH